MRARGSSKLLFFHWFYIPKGCKKPPKTPQEPSRDLRDASKRPQETSKILSNRCCTIVRRAQRAKRAERAIQEASRWMQEAISSVRNDFLRLPSRSSKKNGASRSMSNQVYVGRFFEPRGAQTRQRRAKTHPRRPKMRQEALKTGQRRPKRPPRRAKTRPRRPKMPPDPPRTAKMTTKSSQIGINIAYKIDVNFQKRFFQKCL